MLFTGGVGQLRNICIRIIAVVVIVLGVCTYSDAYVCVSNSSSINNANATDTFRLNNIYNIQKKPLYLVSSLPATCNTTNTDIGIKHKQGITQTEKKAYSRSKEKLKHLIVQATLRAEMIVKQSVKAITIEEEAMLPHHVFTLRQQTVSAGMDEEKGMVAGTSRKRKSILAAVLSRCCDDASVVCLLHVCFFAVAYCYERFYYRQREAYPHNLNKHRLHIQIAFINTYTHGGVLHFSSPLRLFLLANNHPAHEGIRTIYACNTYSHRIANVAVTIAPYNNPVMTFTEVL